MGRHGLSVVTADGRGMDGGDTAAKKCTNMALYVGAPLALLILVTSLFLLVVWVFTFPCLLFALYLYHWHRQIKPHLTAKPALSIITKAD